MTVAHRGDGLIAICREESKPMATLEEELHCAPGHPPMGARARGQDQGRVGGRTEIFEKPIDPMIEFGGQHGDRSTEFRQMQSAPVPDVQGVADAGGQLAHLDVQCGLRDVELFGGPREIEMVGEDGKGPEGIESDQVGIYSFSL